MEPQNREYFWRDLLLRQCKILRKSDAPPSPFCPSKVAIIVEPRRHELLEAVVRNVAYFIGNDWNIEVMTYDGNIDWVKEQLACGLGGRLRVSGLPYVNMNQTLYNAVLLDPWFWWRLKEEHVLIFQTDCILFRHGLDAYLDFDYVGANYFRSAHVAPLIGGIQGGLSLRRRSAMLECMQKVSWNDIQKYRAGTRLAPLQCFHEDIFFTHACEILKKKVVPVSWRKFFSIEAEFYSAPIGHHGTQYRYFTDEQKAAIISQCEDREALW